MTIKALAFKIPFRIWKNIRDDYIEYADKLIVVSELGKRFFGELHPNMNIDVLYPRLKERPEIAYCSDVTDSIKFCYLGNINYITDVEMIVSVFSRIRKEKKVQLHHIGGGQNLGEFENKLRVIGVDFFSHGPVFDTMEKEKIFELCNFGINLPKNEVQSSMSLKSIEYMRSGLPFINSGVGDNWKIVEEYAVGINCSHDTIDEVAEKLLEMGESDYIEMHKKTVECYRKLYGTPDYNSLFSGVPNISIEE